MPYGIRKQPCTDSNGNKGNYVLYITTTGRKVSCHKTRANAEAARRAREANERKNIIIICEKLDKIKKQLRK